MILLKILQFFFLFWNLAHLASAQYIHTHCNCEITKLFHYERKDRFDLTSTTFDYPVQTTEQTMTSQPTTTTYYRTSTEIPSSTIETAPSPTLITTIKSQSTTTSQLTTTEAMTTTTSESPTTEAESTITSHTTTTSQFPTTEASSTTTSQFPTVTTQTPEIIPEDPIRITTTWASSGMSSLLSSKKINSKQ